MQIISFIGYTTLVGIISYLKTRSTSKVSSDNYFLVGRNLSGVITSCSLLLTNLSTEQIVGLNGQVFKKGILLWNGKL